MYEINIYDLDVYKWTVLIGTMEEIEIERCIDKIKEKETVNRQIYWFHYVLICKNKYFYQYISSWTILAI